MQGQPFTSSSTIVGQGAQQHGAPSICTGQAFVQIQHRQQYRHQQVQIAHNGNLLRAQAGITVKYMVYIGGVDHALPSPNRPAPGVRPEATAAGGQGIGQQRQHRRRNTAARCGHTVHLRVGAVEHDHRCIQRRSTDAIGKTNQVIVRRAKPRDERLAQRSPDKEQALPCGKPLIKNRAPASHKRRHKIIAQGSQRYRSMAIR